MTLIALQCSLRSDFVRFEAPEVPCSQFGAFALDLAGLSALIARKACKQTKAKMYRLLSSMVTRCLGSYWPTYLLLQDL